MTKEEFLQTLESRHTKEIQDKLSSSSVAIAGLGGLGSNIAVMLARVGIGHLNLIDFDVVEKSNLNRQQYLIRHLGMKKTLALKNILEEINPFVELTLNQIKVTEENCVELFKNEKIICEAFDDAECKAMLCEKVLTQMSDKILISASGMAGFGNSNSIKTEKIANNFYICGDRISEIKDGFGLMAPRVTLCASHQANLAVQLILENY